MGSPETVTRQVTLPARDLPLTVSLSNLGVIQNYSTRQPRYSAGMDP